jgi:hypothetical protein
MRADYTSVLDPSGPGRKSVRVKTTKAYTTHAVIFDIRHMPQGCATWPAVRESGASEWPNSGKVRLSIHFSAFHNVTRTFLFQFRLD